MWICKCQQWQVREGRRTTRVWEGPDLDWGGGQGGLPGGETFSSWGLSPAISSRKLLLFPSCGFIGCLRAHVALPTSLLNCFVILLPSPPPCLDCQLHEGRVRAWLLHLLISGTQVVHEYILMVWGKVGRSFQSHERQCSMWPVSSAKILHGLKTLVTPGCPSPDGPPASPQAGTKITPRSRLFWFGKSLGERPLWQGSLPNSACANIIIHIFRCGHWRWNNLWLAPGPYPRARISLGPSLVMFKAHWRW